MNLLNFNEQLRDFLETISHLCIEKSINIENHSIDHACYRVESQDAYLKMKSFMDQIGNCLVESEVGGRLISTYQLDKPFLYKSYYIDVIELPAPKEGSFYKEGFEHVEIIAKKPLSFKKRKDFNSELKVSLGDFNIKWHYQSLESVVCLEKNTRIYSALINSELLRHLSEFDPVVVGTFPLELHDNHSDLDIIIGSNDLNRMFEKAKLVCADYNPKNEKQKNFFTLCFSFEGVSFEIYGEKTPSVSQRAFQHFQVEEKFLRVGSTFFKEEIINERSKGLKTEPAFGAILKLEGDPFVELLKFQDMSDKDAFKYLKNINESYVCQDFVTYD